MFNLFSSPRHAHPGLGTLQWRGGRWRGAVDVGTGGATPLVLSGTKQQPDDDAITQALALPALLASHRQQIAAALLEHFEPYGEAQASAGPEEGDSELPDIRTADEALDQADLVAVVVEPVDGVMTVEFCFTTAWDSEHTLGARFQAGKWLELCGSTLVP